MTQRYSFMSRFPVICALGLGSIACASPAANLRPREINREQGAVFGHIKVVNKGQEVTQDCYVELTDEVQRRKAYMSLDDTGWVFTAVNRGPTCLSRVICTLGGFARYNAEYSGRDLRFNVPGDGKIAYFGNVWVDLRSDREDSAAGAALLGAMGLVGGIASALISSNEVDNPQAGVVNLFDEAVGVYGNRYGEQARALEPVISLAGKPMASPSRPPPASAAGFALGKDVAAAEARCTGAGFRWHELDDGRFSCSGAPTDLGVPATVELTACAEAVCKVEVNASADGAAWSALVERFMKLSKLLEGSHGDQQKRETHSLDDCADGVQRCFNAGRVRTSATWSWSDKQRVSLMLDGGPQGGAPSLSLVYGAAARLLGKP